ncbi:MAG: DUF4258 domain-containing protein [Chloroflexota bacterium]
MKTFEQICRQLSGGEFEFSRHAFKRAVERNISDGEIAQVSKNAEIIEDYPDDKYSPSCLILGFTNERRPLHIQASFADTSMVRIITLYEPDVEEWIEFRKRR